VGSEGGLGVSVSAWLRLIPAPEAQVPIAASYPSVEAGVALLGRVYGYGLVPAALEYFDEGCVLATRAAFPEGLHPDARFLVVAEADGTRTEAEALTAELREALGDGALETRVFEDAGDIRALGRSRNCAACAASAQE